MLLPFEIYYAIKACKNGWGSRVVQLYVALFVVGLYLVPEIVGPWLGSTIFVGLNLEFIGVMVLRHMAHFRRGEPAARPNGH